MQTGADNALVAVCRLLPAFTHVLANAPKYLYMHSTFAVMNQWLNGYGKTVNAKHFLYSPKNSADCWDFDFQPIP